MSRIDLHLHTTYSDGSLPPAEVLALAQKANVSTLAVTDHDTVDGIPDTLEAGARLGIEVIPGIEISSRHGEGELHILGYFLDWKDEALRAELARLKETRHDRNPQIIQKLNELGLEITYEEVLALAGNASVGRPHIARVLMSKGYVTSAKEAFDRYLADGAAAHVPRELPSPPDAIALIRAAKGIAVLAHPVWVDRSGDRIYALCESLKAAGLQGIEVHYSTHKPEQTAEYLNTARRLDLLVTGGSDFHGLTKPDIEVGRGRGTLDVSPKLLEPLRKTAASAGALLVALWVLAGAGWAQGTGGAQGAGTSSGSPGTIQELSGGIRPLNFHAPPGRSQAGPQPGSSSPPGSAATLPSPGSSATLSPLMPLTSHTVVTPAPVSPSPHPSPPLGERRR